MTRKNTKKKIAYLLNKLKEKTSASDEEIINLYKILDLEYVDLEKE